MIRRFALSTCLTLMCAMAASAQSATGSDSLNIVNDIERSGRITISQPSALARRLQRSVETNSAPQQTGESQQNTSSASTTRRTGNGFRVEVFADNNMRTAKKNAAARKAKVQARFSQYRTYLVFESPYWRVRVGDFASREAAQAAMAEIRSAMPSIAGDLRVVRSTINR